MKVDLQGTNKFDELNLKIKQLEDKVALHAEREEELLKDKEKLVILYENGIIDSDGEANWKIKDIKHFWINLHPIFFHIYFIKLLSFIKTYQRVH